MATILHTQFDVGELWIARGLSDKDHAGDDGMKTDPGVERRGRRGETGGGRGVLESRRVSQGRRALLM